MNHLPVVCYLASDVVPAMPIVQGCVAYITQKGIDVGIIAWISVSNTMLTSHTSSAYVLNSREEAQTVILNVVCTEDGAGVVRTDRVLGQSASV